VQGRFVEPALFLPRLLGRHPVGFSGGLRGAALQQPLPQILDLGLTLRRLLAQFVLQSRVRWTPSQSPPRRQPANPAAQNSADGESNEQTLNKTHDGTEGLLRVLRDDLNLYFCSARQPCHLHRRQQVSDPHSVTVGSDSGRGLCRFNDRFVFAHGWSVIRLGARLNGSRHFPILDSGFWILDWILDWIEKWKWKPGFGIAF
jgi:hypothetical protein